MGAHAIKWLDDTHEVSVILQLRKFICLKIVSPFAQQIYLKTSI